MSSSGRSSCLLEHKAVAAGTPATTARPASWKLPRTSKGRAAGRGWGPVPGFLMIVRTSDGSAVGKDGAGRASFLAASTHKQGQHDRQRVGKGVFYV